MTSLLVIVTPMDDAGVVAMYRSRCCGFLCPVDYR